jgi:geranylgeranyl pyrophosphate synthase
MNMSSVGHNDPIESHCPAGETQSLDVSIETVLDRSLFAPVRTLFNKPGKRLRADLVQLGWALSSSTLSEEPKETASSLSPTEPVEKASPTPGTSIQNAIDKLAEALEAIHGGSLVIDDIQDESSERRGAPCLYQKFGIPISINVGNWLYFQPFEWIRQLSLPEATELRLYRLFHEAMINAHLGQAIDLGTKIDEIPREQVRGLTLTSLRLKTGALTALAISSGAVLGNANMARSSALHEYGHRFGIALQMFDDIGNFNLPAGHPKRLEDFRLRRPSWLWSVASHLSSQEQYRAFLDAVAQLPNEEPLANWALANRFLETARSEAERHLNESIDLLTNSLGESAESNHCLIKVRELCERIRTSYG